MRDRPEAHWKQGLGAYQRRELTPVERAAVNAVLARIHAEGRWPKHYEISAAIRAAAEQFPDDEFPHS
jgi:hypothetical protein